MATTLVTETDIILGLMSDPDFTRFTALSMVTEQVLRLPELLGSDRLAEKVTFKGIMLLQIELCQAVLETDFEASDPDGRIRRQLRGLGHGFERLVDLTGDLFDQNEPNTSDYFRFIKQVHDRYVVGTLSYAALLRLQPGIFVPKYDPKY